MAEFSRAIWGGRLLSRKEVFEGGKNPTLSLFRELGHGSSHLPRYDVIVSISSSVRCPFGLGRPKNSDRAFDFTPDETTAIAVRGRRAVSLVGPTVLRILNPFEGNRRTFGARAENFIALPSSPKSRL